MNSVVLIGRLANDPELSFTSQNKAVCKLTLAVSRINDGTDFIRVTVWSKQAENCDKYLSKGRQVGVQGRITTGSYEKDGKKVYTTEVTADRVEFLGNTERVSEDEIDRIADSVSQVFGQEMQIGDTFQSAEDDIPF